MEWLKDYWWLILILLVGIFLNVIKDLKRVNYNEYIKKKKGIKPIPYDDDDDDWPKQKSDQGNNSDQQLPPKA